MAAVAERSVSASRQFIVYGTDVRVRGAICDLAEQTKSDLLRTLDQRDEWSTPIIINAQYPQANLPETPRSTLKFSQTGFGLKLQLDLTIAADVSRPEVRRELLRAVALEIIYRAHPDIAAGSDYASPPDWFLEGIAGQRSEFEPAALTDLLAAPVAAQKIIPLEQFLQQRPDLVDAPGRELHRAYSFALIQLLIHSPDGPHRLARFLVDLATASRDPLEGLRAHFPELFGSAGAAEKTWTTQVAVLSGPRPYQLLSAIETERILDATLRFKISRAAASRSYRVTDFAEFPRNPETQAALRRLAQELSALATRANPIYRPIISDYEKVTAMLVAGKRRGISQRLERLSLSRNAIAQQMRGIDDYLNWFEATSARGPSGAFADYLKAAEAANRPERNRRDAMSVYLDVLEAQFQD